LIKGQTLFEKRQMRHDLLIADLTENTCVVSAVVRVVGLLILLSLVRFPPPANLNKGFLNHNHAVFNLLIFRMLLF
jgi:hypothetical protein